MHARDSISFPLLQSFLRGDRVNHEEATATYTSCCQRRGEGEKEACVEGSICKMYRVLQQRFYRQVNGKKTSHFSPCQAEEGARNVRGIQ